MRRALLFLAAIAAIIVTGVAVAPRSAKSAPTCQTTCTLHESMKSSTSVSGMDGMQGGMQSDMHDMGPHMTLTPKSPPNAGDAERAARLVATLRSAIQKYQDYRVAEQDGYVPFLASVPQTQYHFTNWANGAAAQFAFDPTKPTSLLYDKTSDGYRLAGAMYTAPRSATLADLNARVPLSVAQWHEHVNFCKAPPQAGRDAYFGPHAQFGLKGSIATADACTSAGGTFYPIIYNWMVHVYPYETDPAQIWKVGH